MPTYTLSSEVLAPYKRRIFIETGTGRGTGIQRAIDVGFQHIISIEASRAAYAAAVERFKANQDVIIVSGDSVVMLPVVLKTVTEPATFWLDAHHLADDDLDGRDISRCPLLHELKAIENHSITDHTIMIDDMRYFRQGFEGWGGITQRDILIRLMGINPLYRVEFKHGICPNDILVAEVPQ